MNYFQPSFQLLTKSRNGGSVTKRYSKPATPCDRLLARDDVSEETKLRLRKSRSELDPVTLLHSIRESQSALAAIGSVESGGTPDGESLESFLSQLPDLWKGGEVRPTHTEEKEVSITGASHVEDTSGPVRGCMESDTCQGRRRARRQRSRTPACCSASRRN